jgi:predicted Rossmann fold flavoprotein
MPMKKIDVIIIGAGAAGLMCAIEAGKRGRGVLVLDHSNKVGKKILMSGGGRCNFTNLHTNPECYISHNPHFCKSALSRYTPAHFIELVEKHQVPFHEKTLGQLFCDRKSKDIVDLLLNEAADAAVTIQLQQEITKIEKIDSGFVVKTQSTTWQCGSLVIATGGLSIPTLGASPFGYKIAEQFGIKVWPTRAGLVPLTLHLADKETFATLSGVSSHCTVSSGSMQFTEDLLFTHRGLSGPAILQISSYWQAGETLHINWLPQLDVNEFLNNAQKTQPNLAVKSLLTQHLPKRMIETIFPEEKINLTLSQLSHHDMETLCTLLTQWSIKPNGTEGYRTAEVTLGGVDCNALSSKTMEVLSVPGLYFIGEVLDVAGWLGGYNFQWAWASGWAAGQVV